MEMVQVIAQKLQGIHRASLEAAITPVLRAHGVGTAEVSFQMEPSGWVLRVIVESLEQEQAPAPGSEAIHVGLLAEISRDLSAVLDVADLIPHRYSLEVSSAGIERPLRSPRDYERALGRLAKLHLVRPAPDGQRVLRGPILAVQEGAVSIEVDGKPVAAPLDDVERAHLIFELPAHPKAGRPKLGKQKRH